MWKLERRSASFVATTLTLLTESEPAASFKVLYIHDQIEQ